MEEAEVTLREQISKIEGLNEKTMEQARQRQQILAKPPGSLGRLEELSIQMAGITGMLKNQIQKKAVLVFAADNGVVAENVSSAPQSVTLQQTINLTRGKTGAATLARHFGCDLQVYDVGVNAVIKEEAVIDRKLAFGTQNIYKGPAMTRQQAVKALQIGIQATAKAKESHMDVIGIGEMGIGNTTTSSAVLSVLTGTSVERVTGKGGGLTQKDYLHKIQVIEQAIRINQPNREDVIDVLAKVGGFDLAAMTGAFIGAAIERMPVVIDGFISVVAALCAVRINPLVRYYLVPSHASFEIGYLLAMKEMELEPIFQLGMRLGEGSGCPLAFQVLDAGCTILNEMATFEEAGIGDDYLEEIRQGDQFQV